MKIDITREPPADIFRNRGKYLWSFIAFLILGCCGVLLGVYAILSDTHYYENLETASLAIFVGGAMLVSYFGEKLQAYKSLTPDQMKELAEMVQKHPEIEVYCTLMTKAGRQPIRVEFEACQNRAEDADRKNSPQNQ
jgi:hypothetical protein